LAAAVPTSPRLVPSPSLSPPPRLPCHGCPTQTVLLTEPQMPLEQQPQQSCTLPPNVMPVGFQAPPRQSQSQQVPSQQGHDQACSSALDTGSVPSSPQVSRGISFSSAPTTPPTVGSSRASQVQSEPIPANIAFARPPTATGVQAAPGLPCSTAPGQVQGRQALVSTPAPPVEYYTVPPKQLRLSAPPCVADDDPQLAGKPRERANTVPTMSAEARLGRDEWKTSQRAHHFFNHVQDLKNSGRWRARGKYNNVEDEECSAEDIWEVQ